MRLCCGPCPCLWLHLSQMAPSPLRGAASLGCAPAGQAPWPEGFIAWAGEEWRQRRGVPGGRFQGDLFCYTQGGAVPLRFSPHLHPGGHRDICRDSRSPQRRGRLQRHRGQSALGGSSPRSHYSPLLSTPPRLLHPLATGLGLEGV